jgi:hypothetical protein
MSKKTGISIETLKLIKEKELLVKEKDIKR